MADILITGFEMPPKNDTYGLHLVIYPNGDVWIAYDDKPTGKANELSPHGRLIDVDRFMDDNADGFEMNWDNEKWETIGRIFAPFAPVKKALDKAPTIIEAST